MEKTQETRQEIIDTYEAIYAGVEDEKIRESVGELLEVLQQESLTAMQ